MWPAASRSNHERQPVDNNKKRENAEFHKNGRDIMRIYGRVRIKLWWMGLGDWDWAVGVTIHNHPRLRENIKPEHKSIYVHNCSRQIPGRKNNWRLLSIGHQASAMPDRRQPFNNRWLFAYTIVRSNALYSLHNNTYRRLLSKHFTWSARPDRGMCTCEIFGMFMWILFCFDTSLPHTMMAGGDGCLIVLKYHSHYL